MDRGAAQHLLDSLLPVEGLLRKLKANIAEPLAAILTLNTIAHTIGAVGAGAQAAIVFGSTYLGVVSAVLTLLILAWLLYPFVKLSEKMTGRMVEGTVMSGFTRSEFAVMADLSAEEGHLAERGIPGMSNGAMNGCGCSCYT